MTQTLQSIPTAADNSPEGETIPAEPTPQPRGFRFEDIIGVMPDLDEGFEDWVREQRKDHHDRDLSWM